VVVGPWIFALILTLPIFIFLTTVRIPGGDVYCTFNFGSWAQTDEEKLNTAITFVTTRGIIRFLIGFSMPMSIVAIAMDSLLLRSTEEALLIPAVLYESLQQLWLPSLSAGYPFSWWPFWAQSGLKRHCLVVVIKFLTCLLIQQVH
jgi:formyl peptide receptor-like